MKFEDTAREILDTDHLNTTPTNVLVAELNAAHQATVREARKEEVLYLWREYAMQDWAFIFAKRLKELQASQSEKGEE